MKVIATYSIKGGVGKTSTAVNLAYEAGRAGVRVLVWDLDPQGAATLPAARAPEGARRQPPARVGQGSAGRPRARHRPRRRARAARRLLAPAPRRAPRGHQRARRERIAALLEPVRDHYDLAILDCPPSISLASESVFGAADTLLVPVVPATLASRTLGQLTAFLDDQLDAPAVAPFLSMVDRRRRLHRELVDSLGSEWPELLATAIPAAAVIERMGTERAPLAALRAEHARRPRPTGGCGPRSPPASGADAGRSARLATSWPSGWRASSTMSPRSGSRRSWATSSTALCRFSRRAFSELVDDRRARDGDDREDGELEVLLDHVDLAEEVAEERDAEGPDGAADDVPPDERAVLHPRHARR